LASECVSVAAYFRLGGGFNGGTLASYFNLIETGQVAMARDPYLLDPDPAAHTAEERARNADPTGSHYDADLQSWVAPFLMGSVNTRVVRRTQALQGTRFDYQEYSKFNRASRARMVVIGGRVFDSISGSRLGRGILRRFLPKPGEGPSEEVMNKGFFKCELVARTKSGARVRGIMKGQGDAGNRITVKCLCESAFVLALTGAVPSDGGTAGGGVLTPVTGLGEPMLGRLAGAGITFELV